MTIKKTYQEEKEINTADHKYATFYLDQGLKIEFFLDWELSC